MPRSSCRIDVLVATTTSDPKKLLGSEEYKNIGSPASLKGETTVSINGAAGIRRDYAQVQNSPGHAQTVVLVSGFHELLALNFFASNSGVGINCYPVFDRILQSFRVLD